MITEYYRPEKIDQAISLLSRGDPRTIPLAGGNNLSKKGNTPLAVVDLQSLGLDGIEVSQHNYRLGAMVRLQDVVEDPNLPEGLITAARRETNINIRQMATIGGIVASARGNSPLLGCLLALDTRLIWEPGGKSVNLGEWLADERKKKPGFLITAIEFKLPTSVKYEDIARSPEDKPQVFVVASTWVTGEIRIVFGGNGNSPVLASDGSKNMISDIFNRYSHAAAMDRIGFSEYEQSAIKVLVNRLVPQTGIFGGKGLL
jgi:CO/xanthine dehydrogenase FAD-binding subunit